MVWTKDSFIKEYEDHIVCGGMGSFKSFIETEIEEGTLPPSAIEWANGYEDVITMD